MEIYHRAGLAILTPNGEPEITDHGYIEVNRLVGTNLTQGAAAAQFAKEFGFTKAITLNSPWGNYSSRNAYNFQLQSWILGNPQLVYSETTDLVQGGFDKIITRVISSNADIVYFAANGDQVGNFIREARAAGYMGTFMGPNTLSSTWILDNAGPLMLEGGGMYYTRLAAPASFYPTAATFVADYTNRYGTAPMEGIANIYDGVGICLKAIEDASLAKDGELPTRSEVANAIRAITDYQGIAGIYNFNNIGELTFAEYYIVKAISLDPAKWSQNPIIASYKMPPMK
jgi:branched-chain amino acid transport system substrate-binding protein